MALKRGHCSARQERGAQAFIAACLLWKYEEVSLQEFCKSTCQSSPHMKESKGARACTETRALQLKTPNVIGYEVNCSAGFNAVCVCKTVHDSDIVIETQLTSSHVTWEDFNFKDIE